MNIQGKKIGIALSGGGIRATIFHLGVFKWLAEEGVLENIERISSVSGASLCVGLIYSKNDYKWPTSVQYLEEVLPKVICTITENNIQKTAIKKLPFTPKYWNSRVNIISDVIRTKWGVNGFLNDLELKPTWYVNCTTFETGKRFRFAPNIMGDYVTGFTDTPRIPIADVMAASAGFPILIGPYRLQIDQYKWHAPDYDNGSWHTPTSKYINLWDGGVYDNLGLESIYKMDNTGELEENEQYIIVSNASESIGYQKRKGLYSYSNLKRLLDIAMDQVGAVRTRSVMDYINRTGNGMYVKIGNSAEYIWNHSKEKALTREVVERCLDEKEAKNAGSYPTTLETPTEQDIDLLLRHGYEVAMCTYKAYFDENGQAVRN